jgi:hypothetical protein
MKGLTDQMGSYVWDDTGFLYRNGVPMSLNEVKQAVTVEHNSGYGARYRNAGFVAMIPKFFVFNMEKDGVEDEINSIPHRLPWLKALAREDVAALKSLTQDQVAILRRVSLLVLDVWLAPETKEVPKSIQDVLEERKQRLREAGM